MSTCQSKGKQKDEEVQPRRTWRPTNNIIKYAYSREKYPSREEPLHENPMLEALAANSKQFIHSSQTTL